MNQKHQNFAYPKLIAAICQNLPELSDEAIAHWERHPRHLAEALERALETSPELSRSDMAPMRAWATIDESELGDVPDVLDQLRLADCSVTEAARVMLELTASAEVNGANPTNLVVVSVADLGLQEGGRFYDICWFAGRMGLNPCPPSIGPLLRLRYVDQPVNESLRIAMAPVNIGDGHSFIYALNHDARGKHLSSDMGLPGIFWGPTDRFVFAQQK